LKIWNLISQCQNIREMENFFGLTHEIIHTKRSIVCYISNNDIDNKTRTLHGNRWENIIVKGSITFMKLETIKFFHFKKIFQLGGYLVC
jgi:hypothetical protein